MSIFDPQDIVAGGGLALIAFIIFAESGLLFGIVFPGDTLLFAAGFLAAQGDINIWALVITIVIASSLGGNAGYWIGKRTGPKLFTQEEGLFFRREFIQNAEDFYKKHGNKTILLARFVPVIRTFAPVVAGIGSMNQKKFTLYNFVGSGLWATSITLAGYYLGSQFPNLADQIELVFLLAIPFIFAPPIYHLIRHPSTRQKIKQARKNRKENKSKV